MREGKKNLPSLLQRGWLFRKSCHWLSGSGPPLGAPVSPPGSQAPPGTRRSRPRARNRRGCWIPGPRCSCAASWWPAAAPPAVHGWSSSRAAAPEELSRRCWCWNYPASPAKPLGTQADLVKNSPEELDWRRGNRSVGVRRCRLSAQTPILNKGLLRYIAQKEVDRSEGWPGVAWAKVVVCSAGWGSRWGSAPGRTRCVWSGKRWGSGWTAPSPSRSAGDSAHCGAFGRWPKVFAHSKPRSWPKNWAKCAPGRCCSSW